MAYNFAPTEPTMTVISEEFVAPGEFSDFLEKKQNPYTIDLKLIARWEHF
jgi:hypothetical protein